MDQLQIHQALLEHIRLCIVAVQSGQVPEVIAEPEPTEPPPPPPANRYEVIASWLSVRANPGLFSMQVGVLSAASTYVVLEEKISARIRWGKIEYGGGHGWVSMSPKYSRPL